MHLVMDKGEGKPPTTVRLRAPPVGNGGTGEGEEAAETVTVQWVEMLSLWKPAQTLAPPTTAPPPPKGKGKGKDKGEDDEEKDEAKGKGDKKEEAAGDDKSKGKAKAKAEDKKGAKGKGGSKDKK